MIAMGESLELFCDAFGAGDRGWLIDDVEGLKSARARLQDIVWRAGEPMGPIGRVIIIEIGDEPHKPNDILFASFLSAWQVFSHDRPRAVDIAVALGIE